MCLPHPAALRRNIRDSFKGGTRVLIVFCGACGALLGTVEGRDGVRGSRFCYVSPHCTGDLDAGNRRRLRRPRGDVLRDASWLQAAVKEVRDHVVALELVSGGATPQPNWQLRSAWPGWTLALSFRALEELVLADLTIDYLRPDRELTPFLTSLAKARLPQY